MVTDLTRIEPEPVVPKYAVGQRVKIKNDALECYDEIGQVVHLGYYVTRPGYWGIWVNESKLEPVPEPCSACKGTGKAEGATA